MKIIRIAKFSLGGLLGLSVAAQAAGSAKPTLAGSVARAWADLGVAGGVHSETLRTFRSRALTQGIGPDASGAGLRCAADFGDTDAARTDFLGCLAEAGRGAFTEPFFARLFELRIARANHVPSIEEAKSLNLLAYVEDLTRAMEHQRNGGGLWFVRGQGYLEGSTYFDYPFEDGDIVLGLGNTSISASIASATNPRSRYSHAFLVRKERDGLVTLEALVEKGVRKFPREHFAADRYQVLTVLRWKDESSRKRIATAASGAGLGYADAKLGYDINMDLKDSSRMFCTELVARAYADASGLSMDEILPELSLVRSDLAYKYVSQVGVRNRRVIAAGDLLNSPFLDVVAEWRRADDLDRAWKMWSFGALFYERIEQGFTVRPDPVLASAPAGAWLLQLFPSLLVPEARVVPEGLSPWAVSVMGTLELHVFRPSIHFVEDQVQAGRGFAQLDLAELRGGLDFAFQTHGLIPAVFR